MNPSASLNNDLQEMLPLSPAIFFVLFALADGEKHGYLIMQEVKVLSDGKFQMGPATLYTTIQKLADEGKDVVLTMNSYGGFPGTEASKGLSKKEREANGLKGGIIELVYLASFLPAVGLSLRTELTLYLSVETPFLLSLREELRFVAITRR